MAWDVAEARAYIQYFRTYVMPGCDHVDAVTKDTNTKRRIWLDNMTDYDAIFVAGEFGMMEAQAAFKRRTKDN